MNSQKDVKVVVELALSKIREPAYENNPDGRRSIFQQLFQDASVMVRLTDIISKRSSSLRPGPQATKPSAEGAVTQPESEACLLQTLLVRGITDPWSTIRKDCIEWVMSAAFPPSTSTAPPPTNAISTSRLDRDHHVVRPLPPQLFLFPRIWNDFFSVHLIEEQSQPEAEAAKPQPSTFPHLWFVYDGLFSFMLTFLRKREHFLKQHDEHSNAIEMSTSNSRSSSSRTSHQDDLTIYRALAQGLLPFCGHPQLPIRTAVTALLARISPLLITLDDGLSFLRYAVSQCLLPPAPAAVNSGTNRQEEEGGSRSQPSSSPSQQLYNSSSATVQGGLQLCLHNATLSRFVVEELYVSVDVDVSATTATAAAAGSAEPSDHVDGADGESEVKWRETNEGVAGESDDDEESDPDEEEEAQQQNTESDISQEDGEGKADEVQTVKMSVFDAVCNHPDASVRQLCADVLCHVAQSSRQEKTAAKVLDLLSVASRPSSVASSAALNPSERTLLSSSSSSQNREAIEQGPGALEVALMALNSLLSATLKRYETPLPRVLLTLPQQHKEVYDKKRNTGHNTTKNDHHSAVERAATAAATATATTTAITRNITTDLISTIISLAAHSIFDVQRVARQILTPLAQYIARTVASAAALEEVLVHTSRLFLERPSSSSSRSQQQEGEWIPVPEDKTHKEQQHQQQSFNKTPPRGEGGSGGRGGGNKGHHQGGASFFARRFYEDVMWFLTVRAVLSLSLSVGQCEARGGQQRGTSNKNSTWLPQQVLNVYQRMDDYHHHRHHHGSADEQAGGSGSSSEDGVSDSSASLLLQHTRFTRILAAVYAPRIASRLKKKFVLLQGKGGTEKEVEVEVQVREDGDKDRNVNRNVDADDVVDEAVSRFRLDGVKWDATVAQRCSPFLLDWAVESPQRLLQRLLLVGGKGKIGGNSNNNTTNTKTPTTSPSKITSSAAAANAKATTNRTSPSLHITLPASGGAAAAAVTLSSSVDIFSQATTPTALPYMQHCVLEMCRILFRKHITSERTPPLLFCYLYDDIFRTASTGEESDVAEVGSEKKTSSSSSKDSVFLPPSIVDGGDDVSYAEAWIDQAMETMAVVRARKHTKEETKEGRADSRISTTTTDSSTTVADVDTANNGMMMSQFYRAFISGLLKPLYLSKTTDVEVINRCRLSLFDALNHYYSAAVRGIESEVSADDENNNTSQPTVDKLSVAHVISTAPDEADVVREIRDMVIARLDAVCPKWRAFIQEQHEGDEGKREATTATASDNWDDSSDDDDDDWDADSDDGGATTANVMGSDAALEIKEARKVLTALRSFVLHDPDTQNQIQARAQTKRWPPCTDDDDSSSTNAVNSSSKTKDNAAACSLFSDSDVELLIK